MIDEKALENASRAYCDVIRLNYDGLPAQLAATRDEAMRRAIATYLESAKPKEAEEHPSALVYKDGKFFVRADRIIDSEPLKLGSRLTVEGVEAVLVPVEPTRRMVEAAYDRLDWGPPGYDDAPDGEASAEKTYRAMLSQAGDKE